jgi:hypothetical protein
MLSHARHLRALRRLSAAATAAVVLFSATTLFGQSSAKEKVEKTPKNYSIPWIITLAGMAGIAVPVGMATRRKWELPFEGEEDEK